LVPDTKWRFAEDIRREAGVLTGAVGMIPNCPGDQIIRGGHADVVILARQFLRDPYWPLIAARRLGTTSNGRSSTSGPKLIGFHARVAKPALSGTEGRLGGVFFTLATPSLW